MEKRNIILIIAEILVMGGILIAFIAPLLFPTEEPTESWIQPRVVASRSL